MATLSLNNLITGYFSPMLYQTYDCLIDKPHKLYETTSTQEQLVPVLYFWLLLLLCGSGSLRSPGGTTGQPQLLLKLLRCDIL